MATLFKLILTALVINASVQAGRSAWGFYQFQDAVHEAVLFSGNQTAPQLRDRLIELADEQGLPLDPETVDVSYSGTQARIEGSYVDPVKLVPGVFTYEWTHALDMNVRRTAY